MNFFGNKGRSSDIVSQTETKNVYTCTFYGVVFVIHFDYIYLDLPFIKKKKTTFENCHLKPRTIRVLAHRQVARSKCG